MGESFKEKRVRSLTHLYYSRADVQGAIFDFALNREIAPRYFDGFGKRPDSFEYLGDVFELAKKGATSFHCSEELWRSPLDIVTGMGEDEANDLRVGWDLLLDVDCKWFDYSKLAAKAIIETLREHGVVNVGVKFSGSKGWHILVPWKAFPKEVGGVGMKDLFPEVPRKIADYIRFKAGEKMKNMLPSGFYEDFKGVDIKEGFQCNECKEIVECYELVDFFCPECKVGEQRKFKKGEVKDFKCPNCFRNFVCKRSVEFYECGKCRVDSVDNPSNFSVSVQKDLFELMGLDIVLVSSRHLFRVPYSLHEKTALASVVISADEIEGFEMRDASPMGVEVKNFMPESKEGEASELLLQALDWASSNRPEKKVFEKRVFSPVKITDLSDKNFPCCIQKILCGLSDGRKRALFVLINFFRSLGLEKEEVEERIANWNELNKPPVKNGYVKSQISWSFRKGQILPPNCRDFYRDLGVCVPDNLCGRIKNPVNYVVRRSFKG